MRLVKIDIFTRCIESSTCGCFFFFFWVGRVIFCVMLYLLCRMQHIHIRISTALNNAVQFHVVKLRRCGKLSGCLKNTFLLNTPWRRLHHFNPKCDLHITWMLRTSKEQVYFVTKRRQKEKENPSSMLLCVCISQIQM